MKTVYSVQMIVNGVEDGDGPVFSLYVFVFTAQAQIVLDG